MWADSDKTEALGGPQSPLLVEADFLPLCEEVSLPLLGVPVMTHLSGGEMLRLLKTHLQHFHCFYICSQT